MNKYACASHHQKRNVLETVIRPARIELFAYGPKAIIRHWPDLLVYADSGGDWFFCEVKGPRDRLRPEQLAAFALLARETGKPVYQLDLTDR